ncbi:constitutive coactivator of PPAR-gamma-like protein 1 homolog [Pogonomyrmex barbatus]|uniref:Constitutive coactivator of PPAR-gamma-like protein 1 homolog n=1 Tax=Pogonomyrmex barbatus TaxID=144034 RepID=A0A6I9VW02_9HYME|nr:constitutive coactivator of PPAR-gamma-like protein 1 homolog [Pogonomyrmex barbatus]
MGIQDLQTFLDGNSVQGGSIPVDLLKIARMVAQKSQRNRIIKGQQLHNFGKFRLVLDGECCLDRLYGGFFSDWACGGQWNRMLQFLAVLIQAMEMSGLEVTVFFNGCFEPLRRADWVQHQLQVRGKVNNVLKHITTKGTPPPKIWWTSPVCLRTSLRMALRHLNVTVFCSMDDHHQEVIAYCRENNYNGLIADDAEYAAFDPPRYFSSEQLKLTYKKTISLFLVHKLDSKSSTQIQSNLSDIPSATEGSNLETSRFASETLESERESLNAYKQATANAKTAPQIVIDPPGIQSHGDVDAIRAEEEQSDGHAINGTHNLLISSSSSSSSSSATSPSHATTDIARQSEKITNIPTTSPEVMRTASERHQKGLMSPYIYQILIAGEIKLPVLLEDENHREFPSIHVIYRPIRQMVYAILFNLHHRMYLATKSKEKGDNEKIEVPDVIIKEWIWSKSNPYQTPELVKAEQIGWGVPTIQRLWFGTAIDDKRRRLRGFLTCMRSDTPLMLNTSYVPQHLLVMACVLRYIMSFSDKIKILRRQELDAFIAQAFSPELMNAQYLQDLQLPLVTSRGVQLATLFMAGVETALLANDACGAPIPWLMCCPWLYFDGKLFHHTLARATIAKNLLELCSGHIDRVVKVERMRKAILEGITVVFARPPLPVTPGIRVSVPSNILPANCTINDGLMRGRGSGVLPQRSLMRRPIPSRGGQLEIAGVVVGQWGPNYGQPGRLPQPLQGQPRGRIPPQVTSIGGLKYGLPRGFNPINRPTFQTRGASRVPIAGRGKKTQMKVTGKKKTTIKKTKETEKKDSKGRGIIIDGITDYNETQIDNARALLTKDAQPVPGQFDDAVENGKSMEKGQGDAPVVTPVATEN